MKSAFWVALFVVFQQYRSRLVHGAIIESDNSERGSLSESIESIVNGSITASPSTDPGTNTQNAAIETTTAFLPKVETPTTIPEDLLSFINSIVNATTTPTTDGTTVAPNQETYSSTTKLETTPTEPSTHLTNPTSTIPPPVTTTKPTEVQQAVKETVHFIQVPPNLFPLGSTTPTGSIGGVISEALKLAQVSIAVFGSQILGTLLGGPTYVISNTTRLVGVGK